MKFLITLVAIVLAVSISTAQQKQEAKITKEHATKTALEQVKGGKIQSSELEKEEGKLIWSFDIKSDNEIREVWIDATTGAVVKTETESVVKEKDEKVMDKAEKVALKKVPGTVIKKDIEKVKSKTIYEFIIKSKAGKISGVAVDAKTNKVIKVKAVNTEKEELKGNNLKQ